MFDFRFIFFFWYQQFYCNGYFIFKYVPGWFSEEVLSFEFIVICSNLILENIMYIYKRDFLLQFRYSSSWTTRVVYKEAAAMLCRIRLHGPCLRSEEQGGKTSMLERTRRLHHRHKGCPCWTSVPRDCQNGKLTFWLCWITTLNVFRMLYQVGYANVCAYCYYFCLVFVFVYFLCSNVSITSTRVLLSSLQCVCTCLYMSVARAAWLPAWFI